MDAEQGLQVTYVNQLRFRPSVLPGKIFEHLICLAQEKEKSQTR